MRVKERFSLDSERVKMTTPTDVFANNDEFEDQRFEGLKLEGHRLDSRHFYDCEFVRCKLSRATFDSCVFENCLFQDCDLTTTRIGESAFRQVKFDRSKLMGVDWSEARQLTFQADFVDCVLSFGVFVGMTLNSVSISGCTVEEADFSEADLRKTAVVRSDFARSQFSAANLRGTDLSSCTNVLVDPRETKLGKTKLSLLDGVACLSLFGLEIPEVALD